MGTTPNSDLNGNFPNYPDWTQDGDENDTYVGNETDRTHAVDQTNTQEEVLLLEIRSSYSIFSAVAWLVLSMVSLSEYVLP